MSKAKRGRSKKTKPTKGWDAAAEDAMRALCEARGLSLRVGVFHSNQKRHVRLVAHVMVEDAGGARLVDWWPATGTWKAGGERGVLPEAAAVVELAAGLVAA